MAGSTPLGEHASNGIKADYKDSRALKSCLTRVSTKSFGEAFSYPFTSPRFQTRVGCAATAKSAVSPSESPKAQISFDFQSGTAEERRRTFSSPRQLGVLKRPVSRPLTSTSISVPITKVTPFLRAQGSIHAGTLAVRIATGTPKEINSRIRDTICTRSCLTMRELNASPNM